MRPGPICHSCVKRGPLGPLAALILGLSLAGCDAQQRPPQPADQAAMEAGRDGTVPRPATRKVGAAANDPQPRAPRSSSGDGQGRCGPCSDCPNPLVELKDIRLGGSLPEISNYGGWYEAGQGYADVFSRYLRGMDYLCWRDEHPCADVQYYVDVGDEYVGSQPMRMGPRGKPKYEVRSEILIVQDTQGSKVPIRHIVEKQTRLKEPVTSQGGNLQWHTVETISDKVELVPLLGSISVEHQLVALKNNQVYDKGNSVIDWVASPPPDEGPDVLEPGQSKVTHSYFCAWKESISDGGQVCTSHDGLVIGDFAPGDLASVRVAFTKGDIGITIRKTETPSTAVIQVDDRSAYSPHLKLSVTDIRNQFDEPLPDNVRIAIQAEKGRIASGEKWVGGWSVFTTRQGAIREQVLYEPPDCDEGSIDTLWIAAVCDYHDGPASVSRSRIQQKVANPHCFDLTVHMRATCSMHAEYHDEDSIGTSDRHATGYGQAVTDMALKHAYNRDDWGQEGSWDEVYEGTIVHWSYSYSVRGLEVNTVPGIGTNVHHRYEQAINSRLDHDQVKLHLYIDKDGKVKYVSWNKVLINYTRKCWATGAGSDGDHYEFEEGPYETQFGLPPWALTNRCYGRPERSLIPTFGDGVRHFGGETRQVRRGGEDDHIGLWDMDWCVPDYRENAEYRATYRWEITRRPKQAQGP